MSNKKYPEFFLSSWAIDNRTTIYIFTFIIVMIGVVAFNTLPKENFPEIQIPTIYVGTVYPGTSPADIENLVTRKIEKELKAVKGVKDITSTSIQDYSTIFIEFETSKDLKEAKREVQEAVDKARSDLPSDLPRDPNVMDINLSEIPIMFVNVSGNLDNVTLKKYAEDIQEEIEKLSEISRVEIVGALDQEVQVDVDLYKMEAAGISFYDIENAIARENVVISGGELDISNSDVAIRVSGEFKSISDIENLVVSAGRGNSAYLRDIATVRDGFKDRESYARLDGQPVLTLNVIKKAGENLVNASDKIKDVITELQAEKLPASLKVSVSGDQSQYTRNTLNELTNTIIIGFLLVAFVLTFFMGIRDAIFVGLAVPLSSFIAFAVLPFIGFTMNLVVLFSFILALGIVVDNAIVVIENVHRIFNEEGLPLKDAAKKAAGEVIGPVFAGTLTTMAPFLPLVFWEGVVGEFMFFMPVTMIITLAASLFVAYVINPVFAVSFMTRIEDEKKVNHLRIIIYVVLAVLIGLIFHLAGNLFMGNLMFFMAVFVAFNTYVLSGAIAWFQRAIIPVVKNAYRNLLRWTLRGWNPALVLGATFVLFIFSFGVAGSSNLKVVFFPETEPNFIYVYNSLPVGTPIETTDSVTRLIEERVYEVIGRENPVVKSVITNVALGASDPNSMDRTAKSNKSKLTVEFVEFKYRQDVSTREIMGKIRDNVKGIPGSEIVVDQEQSGPPTAPPVNIEVSSEEFTTLISYSDQLKSYLDSLSIAGIEELKWDLELNKPELVINVNREKASELGVSTGQIGSAIRTAVFGKEASKYRENEDEYPIQVRLDKKYRENLPALLDMRISFRDQSSGKFKSIPISAFADVEYTSTYGGINRKDLKKVVSITSNVLSGYNVAEVNNEVTYWIDQYTRKNPLPSGMDIKLGGELEEQEETAAFLGTALGASIMLILLILITQFNSISNVLIILSQVLFSLIGVLLGYVISGMDISVVMSGVGIVALAGIVVNNGIILLDFFRILHKRGYSLEDSVIEGGAIRFTPVMLTAISTILGLVPLALSMNINFVTLITKFNPQIFFGGDNASFWGPLAWTIIFGLTFATVVTLLVIPATYYLVRRFERWSRRKMIAWGLLESSEEDEAAENMHNDESRELEIPLPVN